MINSKLYLSNSSIQTFMSCKRKFKYKYIDKVKPQSIASSKHLSYGQSIHTALAQFNMITDKKYRTVDFLHKLLRNNWIRDGYESIEEEKIFGNKALRILTGYYENPQDKSLKNMIIEGMIKKDLDDNVILCGKIDKGFINTHNVLEILDYKTGDKIEHGENFSIDLQLAIYTILAKEKFGEYPKFVSYYYLAHNKKILREINDFCIEEINNYIFNIIKLIQKEKEFSCSPSQNCKTFCEYFDLCDVSKYESSLIINQINAAEKSGQLNTVF